VSFVKDSRKFVKEDEFQHGLERIKIRHEDEERGRNLLEKFIKKYSFAKLFFLQAQHVASQHGGKALNSLPERLRFGSRLGYRLCWFHVVFLGHYRQF
jgi:hypothetical protein